VTAGGAGWLRRLVPPATTTRERHGEPGPEPAPRASDEPPNEPAAARSPRDAQRIRVYRAETPLVGRRFSELDQCRAYCEQVVGSFWWLERFPDHHLAAIPTLRDGRGARQAFYREDPGHPTITLPRRYRTSGVILHELVHWVMRADEDLPNHGRTFARLLLDLTGEFAGPAARDRLADAYTEHAVKVGEPARRGPDGRWRYGIDERLRLRRGEAVTIHHGEDALAAPVRGRLVAATTRRVTVEVDEASVVIGRDGVWSVAPG
jgi:putative metallohydrolase (TIGR04338 family)